LAFGEEEFFIAFAMACSEAFFNNLLVLVLYRKSAFSEVDDRGRLFWRAFDKAT
jgi:hypothetical protein